MSVNPLHLLYGYSEIITVRQFGKIVYKEKMSVWWPFNERNIDESWSMINLRKGLDLERSFDQCCIEGFWRIIE